MVGEWWLWFIIIDIGDEGQGGAQVQALPH